MTNPSPGKESWTLLREALRWDATPGAFWAAPPAASRRRASRRLLDVNLRKLRQELEDSRDYPFSAAGVPQDLFRPN